MGWGKAAAAQNQATQQAMLAQAQQAAQAQNALQQGQQQATAAYQPYAQFGQQSTNRLADLMGVSENVNAPGYGSLMQQPTIEQIQMDPSYKFREEQGMKALQQSAAARGGLLSGSTLKGIQQYGQGLASTEYGNAYNRFMQNRANQLAMLQGGQQTGFGAAQGIGNAAIGTSTNLAQNYQNLGQGIGQGYANIGANNAAAYMGPTNAMSSLLGQALQAGAYMYGRG